MKFLPLPVLLFCVVSVGACASTSGPPTPEERAATRDVQLAEQAAFAQQSRATLDAIDARLDVVRQRGQPVDFAILNERNIVASHIDACDDEPLTQAAWATQRTEVSRELTALDAKVAALEAKAG